MSPLLLDSLILLILRAAVFLISRRFLLVTLNPTLRGLSTAPSQSLPIVSPAASHLRPPSTNATVISDQEFDSEDDQSPASTTANTPLRKSSWSEAPIDMRDLGQTLQSASKNQVLHLSHGKTVGTKEVKRAARGLSRIARILFSICVAEGCNLISLVMFHATGVLHSRSRHINFSFSLHLLLAMILVILPMVQCLLFTYRSRGNNSVATRPSSLRMRTRILISVIPFSLYAFLFSLIPPYVTTIGSEEDDSRVASWNQSSSWLSFSMGRVIVLGVVILGALSGFGAITTALNYLEHIRSAQGSLSEGDILQAERSLYRVRQDLINRQPEVNPDDNTSWVGRMLGKGSGGSSAEIKGLQAMEYQLRRSLSAMKNRKRQQQFGQTALGKVYSGIGYIFAVYCSARVLMALPSLFTTLSTSRVPTDEATGTGNANGDWISYLIALGLSHLPTEVDVAMWARAISLLLTGLLIVSSLSQVLRGLSSVMKMTSRTVGSGFLLLFLAQLFSTYVISLLVQLRKSIPRSPEETESDPFIPTGDDSLLSSLPDFRIFGRLFDVVFLLASLGTGLIRILIRKMNAADDSGEIYQHS